jgi:dipeptidyl aminopeptidase/acylaminoacyl peptidase
VPVLLIHSKDDTYVPPENMESLFDGLVNAQDKTKLYITGSGHVVARGVIKCSTWFVIHQTVGEMVEPDLVSLL